jgi:hypothetical protein
MRRFVPLVLLGVAAVATAQTPVISVKTLMTAGEFEAAGLNKLTKEEVQALDKWLIKTLVEVTQRTGAANSRTGSSSPSVPGTYPIEASVNDETFIINGEVFKARTYCFKMDKGDRVKFVDGSANGVCTSAKFLNMRTGDVCEVWCE